MKTKLKIDEGTMDFLRETKICINFYSKWILDNIGEEEKMQVIKDGIGETRILRFYINKQGLLMTSLSGMHGVLIKTGSGYINYRIPESIFKGMSLGDGSNILRGLSQTESFSQYIESIHTRVID